MHNGQGRIVVFVTPGFSEPGGCANHGRKLAEGLAERGWRVHVVARLGSGRRFRRLHGPRLDVTEIPGFGRRRLGGALFLALAPPLVLTRRRPHAFMAMQLSTPATVASIATIFRPRRRFVVFSTSTGPAGEAAFVRASRARPLRRWLLRRASTLVAQTDDAAEELRMLLPGARVTVVPTPVRLRDPVPPLNGGPSVVYSGRIVEGKNLDALLALWHEVVARVPGAQLTLVGNGWPGDPVEAGLRQAIASSPQLRNTVTMTGWVSDVAPYLERADVFVLPSAHEGMSNALLEACAVGRVVVASDIPGNRAVVGENYPLLFDASDRQGFQDALVAGLTDNALRTEARRLILGRVKRFDVASVVDQIEELLSA